MAISHSLLRHLMELCQHDYSEFNGTDVDEDGRFGYRYLDYYWREPGRCPFLVRVPASRSALCWCAS